VLAFYHPFLLILVLGLVAAVALIVFGFGWRGTRTAVDSNGMTTSWWGMRGSEDLGGGDVR
jgi:predicted porin